MTYDPDTPPPVGLSARRAQTSPVSAQRSVVQLAIVAAVFALSTSAAIAVWIAASRHAPASPARMRSFPVRSNARRATTGSAITTRRPEELPGLPMGTHLLATNPPGGYENWDAVAQVPWAVTIAHAWSNEASLQRIDVTHVRPDGTLDVVNPDAGDATYRFWPTAQLLDVQVERPRSATVPRTASPTTNAPNAASPTPNAPNAANGPTAATQTPAALAASAAPPASAALPPVGFELWIRVHDGRTEAVISPLRTVRHMRSSSLADVAPPLDSLPLRDIIPHLMERHDFADTSTLIGYLIPLNREGWTWYLNDPSSPPLPRIRARDGRPIS